MIYRPTYTVARHSAPAEEPLSLDAVKLHLRITHDGEDASLTQMIAAAREVAEEITNRSFIAQGWKLTLQCMLPLYLSVPYGPLLSVTSLTRRNEDGSTDTLDTALLRSEEDGNALRCLSPQEGEQFSLVYEAGLSADAAGVPAGLKQALLQHVGYLYSFRAGENASGVHDISALYSPWRRVRV